MSDKPLDDMVEEYLAVMVPVGASQDQIDQTRFAFIAGGAAMFQAMLEAGTGGYENAAVLFSAIEKNIESIVADIDSPPSTGEVTH